MKLPFTKMHGISNDYIYVNAFETSLADPGSVSLKISDRRTGIGGDGLILICPSETAHARMEMYNADGSRGEMCGNGIRCVGKYIYDHGIARDNPLKVDTDAGLKVLFLDVENGRVTRVTVDMGEPILDGAKIPVAVEGEVIEKILCSNFIIELPQLFLPKELWKGFFPLEDLLLIVDVISLAQKI